MDWATIGHWIDIGVLGYFSVVCYVLAARMRRRTPMGAALGVFMLTLGLVFTYAVANRLWPGLRDSEGFAIARDLLLAGSATAVLIAQQRRRRTVVT